MILLRAVTAVLLVATPAPITADPVDWHYAHCATGEITEYHATKPGRFPVVTVKGWIRPCEPSGSTDSFGIMYVTPTANVVPALSPYDSPDAPTEFSVSFPFSPLAAGWWTEYGGVLAVCLVHGPASWLGCVRLEPGAGLPQVTPWTPARSDLCANVEVSPPGGPVYRFIEPSCGTCV